MERACVALPSVAEGESLPAAVNGAADHVIRPSARVENVRVQVPAARRERGRW